MGRRGPSLERGLKEACHTASAGDCITFGYLDFDAGLVSLVNVAVYALRSVGQSMSDLLCPTPVPRLTQKSLPLGHGLTNVFLIRHSNS